MKKTKQNVNKPYTDPVTGKFAEGNPGGGRPKGSFSLVEMIKKKLQEECPEADKTYAEMFIDKLIEKSLDDGDVTILKEMITRVDGLPTQKIESKNLNVDVEDITEKKANEIKQAIFSSTTQSPEKE